MADFGYDVADYTGVDPLFGTLADFDALLAATHARKLKVILDFVPNHTSSQHLWFLESRSSRQSAKRDWYLWRDPAPGDGPPETRPPNNWLSHFGGPSWTFDQPTGQFYLHSFLKEQPDLNWRNPAVREAIYAAMRFWLDKGVAGFRMDVLWLLIKDEYLRSNPTDPASKPYNADQPETHEIVATMRSILDEYPGDRLLIGEIYLPLPQLVAYYGAQMQGAQLPFNFHLILTRWEANAIAAVIQTYESLLPTTAWPNYVLGNHDQSRLATRIGPAQARVAAMLLLTLRGTPTLYYGDELGMTDVPISQAEVQDPAEKNQPGLGLGRDPERSPMLWDSRPNAGFTTGTPWLPLLADRARLNVETQTTQPASMLALYRKLLSLRREHLALHSGSLTDLSARDGVLTYRRTSENHEGRSLQVFLNLTAEHRQIPCPAGRILLTTIMDGEGAPVGPTLILEAAEGVLIQLDEP
jgi:alpha-glucosidase